MRSALERSGRGLAIAVPLAILAAALLVARPAPARPPEFRSGDRTAFAITKARVLAAPGRVFDPGVVVVRGGLIEAVGDEASTPIPSDARVLDRRGRVIHSAFIDPLVPADRLGGKRPRSPVDDEDAEMARAATTPSSSPSSPSDPSHAEQRVIDGLRVSEKVADSYRRVGFAVVAAAPVGGILRGRGAVVGLGDGALEERVLAAESAHYVSLDPDRGDVSSGSGRGAYPVSKMGAMAVVRQRFATALWWRDAEAAYGRKPVGRARPPYDPGAAALVPAAEGRETVVFEAGDVLSLLRGLKIARELKLKARFVGAGDEYRLRQQVAEARPDLVLRVDFPRPYRTEDDAEWIDVPLERLQRIDRSPSNPAWLREAGIRFSFTTAGLDEPEEFPRRVREAIARGLSRQDAFAAVTTVPAAQLGFGDRLGSIEPGKIANLVASTGEPFTPNARPGEIWIDGRHYDLPDRRGSAAARGAGGASGSSAESRPEPEPDARAFPPPDRGPVASPAAVVIRHATIWTEGPAGLIEDGDLVAVHGRITAVGRALAAPPGAVEVDGRGLHLTPGLVDCHSHSAMDGAGNEGTHAVSAEVRVQDVIDPFDVAAYRELAGGTTTANVLHGSANAIGGQNAVVKWRWGGGPDDDFFAGAPAGIKFALGENPKQSNWTNPRPRYPATRMGVANLIRERFLAARDYRRRQEEYRKAASVRGASPIPPAPDLQLEAIAEILEGKRMIHCHSYRKDEILAMIRVAEEFGVKVGTFQHVLEGYKVADEIAKHGAGASTFSDWWAYKPEAYDAIPYNGALMRERGVLVSFNSDSDELARRLNWEAAKAVRYGNVPPAEALAFVTSNPAKQLGIFQRVGSLEPGKDADFVLWSGDPLATSSIALQTWIEGRRYFDRRDDLARRPALERERAELVDRARRMLEADRRAGRAAAAPSEAPAGGAASVPSPAAVRPAEEGEKNPTPPPPAPASVSPRPTPVPTARPQ
ncbi:MAG: amidohydrolase family protein [Acidobacteriota bacterium]